MNQTGWNRSLAVGRALSFLLAILALSSSEVTHLAATLSGAQVSSENTSQPEETRVATKREFLRSYPEYLRRVRQMAETAPVPALLPVYLQTRPDVRLQVAYGLAERSCVRLSPGISRQLDQRPPPFSTITRL